MDKAIEVRELVKGFGGPEPVVRGLSFSVAEGEFFGLLGPNGAGKTTTIHILCGWIRPEGGQVRILGEMGGARPHPHLGLAPQENALFSALTLTENLEYFAALYGLPSRISRKRSEELICRLELEAYRHKRFGRFSGGMKRRANLAAALIHKPRLLILDEPTAGVDVQSRALILDYLREIHAQGTTIVYTSHLLSEAESLCQRLLIMDHGQTLDSGSPQQLKEAHGPASSLEEVFLRLTGIKSPNP